MLHALTKIKYVQYLSTGKKALANKQYAELLF